MTTATDLINMTPAAACIIDNSRDLDWADDAQLAYAQHVAADLEGAWANVARFYIRRELRARGYDGEIL